MPSINEMKKKKKPFNPDVIDLVMEDVASNSPATDEISLFSNNRVAQNEEKTLDLKKRPTMFLEHKKIYPNPLNKRYVAHLTDNDFNILKASIMEMGLMHNLVVLEDGKGGYRLLSGEKRWTAIGKMTEEEMKKQLGLPIFYRIDKMIHFEDFGCDTIYAIVRNEISAREEEYKDKLTQEEIYAAVSPLVSTVGENARTIKYKIQKVIEELLFQEVNEKMMD